MAVIIKFPLERCRPSQPMPARHRATVIPFPVRTKPHCSDQEVNPYFKPISTTKKALIAKVKIAQKQIAMPDSAYRTLLFINFGVRSCTELDEQELVRLVGFFHSKGFRNKPSNKTRGVHGKPRYLKKGSPSASVMARIEELLKELGRIRGTYAPWDLAVSILKKNTGIDHLEQATFRELSGVLAALTRIVQSER